MRELEFRAWKNNGFEFFDVREDNDFDFYHFYIGAGDNIEQYTGIKDKNGKEIYEGDICRLTYSEIRKGQKRCKKVWEDINRVEFEDGCFKFIDTDQYGIVSELPFSDYGEYLTADGGYEYEAEVIGNIHENPELLEERDEN